MGDEVKRVQEKVSAFRRKYYLSIFLKGSLLSAAIVLAYFLLAALLEHALWLDSSIRLLLFGLFLGLIAFCLYRFLKDPLRFWVANKGLDDEQSARLIGEQIPTVKDRLINFFQLSAQAENSMLGAASVRQKAIEFEPFSFEGVINLKENLRYLKYLSIPLVAALIILVFNSSVLTKSSARILHFNQKFSPEAPFKFIINNSSAQAFANEDFLLKVSLEGTAIPSDVYLVRGDQRMKLVNEKDNSFTYQFDRLQEDLTFQLEAAGFYSDAYTITVVSRPELSDYNLLIEYPNYIQRKKEEIKNAGNLEIPEGTRITWRIGTNNSKSVSLSFANDPNSPYPLTNPEENLFTFSKNFRNSTTYELGLSNENGSNKDLIRYQLDVVKDKHPELSVLSSKDSVLYQYISLSGALSDDYGIKRLNLVVLDENTKKASREIAIPIVNNLSQQNFFFLWQLDTLKLEAGDRINYYIEVWDNDGVNGSKSTRSATYTFALPTKEALTENIRQSEKATQQKISQSQARAAELQKKLEEASKQLKSTQSMNWQDKKKLEDILQQKKELEKLLDELKQENKDLLDKKDAFTEESERIKEKAEQIQKLMEELLDDETKKLFEELEKLMKENADPRQMEKLLDKMQKNSGNLEKELERTLELFKQLQLDSKVEQATEQLNKNIEEQKQLLEKTEQSEKSNKGKEAESKSNEALAQEQEKLAEESKQLGDQLEEIKELDKEVSGTNLDLPSEEQQENVEQQQQQSKESLEQGKPGKSKDAQQKAIQQMQQMKEKLESMQSAMSMEMEMANLESLRQIIHGLIKLSFDQENLINNFRELNQSDPRFNPLAQQQIKIKDDAKILADSLLALGKRDAMMGSFITKEVTELNDHLDKTIEANKERRRGPAQSEMQFSMTSINNLALMLDDHFDMMMQMMANAKPGAGKGKKKGKPQSLSQMQQQLNQRIQEMKNGGKSGKELSEELAKTAAEQERIRRALQEFQEKMKQQGKEMPGGDLLNKMEQSEMDLVNKQLTEQLIRRQKEIESRLLEAEQSMREQEEDEERKGETAKDYNKEMPKAYEEYLRLKEKEVELLKTVPPKLYPYYKQEVNEYFKRLRDQ
ncbi:DUF4175 domain-containing protein [Chryseotalea sanaruensis]|uniref:DUF4175 domain-containing protein n=1 Tax=Chryseotalea sanaruensis TaxID=2482724 RepID=A0A401U832_9BACT|nr:DUF4175 family protein [Chryseotalea sanaruensis]GCC51058.1 DUF4175 domain-containing protein [Chryseotalea sanaruensis]